VVQGRQGRHQEGGAQVLARVSAKRTRTSVCSQLSSTQGLAYQSIGGYYYESPRGRASSPH
jgi:hypothetical protein